VLSSEPTAGLGDGGSVFAVKSCCPSRRPSTQSTLSELHVPRVSLSEAILRLLNEMVLLRSEKESRVCLVLRFSELVQGSVAPASAMTLLVRTASNNREREGAPGHSSRLSGTSPVTQCSR
jgi:hypothetical protein